MIYGFLKSWVVVLSGFNSLGVYIGPPRVSLMFFLQNFGQKMKNMDFENGIFILCVYAVYQLTYMLLIDNKISEN